MSIKEVTRLRKEGKLKEAYDLAFQEFNADKNEWTCMSLFWVVRDLATTLFLPGKNMEKAQQCLEFMESLLPRMKDDNGIGMKAYQSLSRAILPNAAEVKAAFDLSKENPNEAYKKITDLFGTGAEQLDVKLHEDFGWIVYRYMKANSENLSSIQIRCLLRDYMQLKNERPSLLHSVILNYALNFSKGHPDFSFYKFFLLWNAKNLRMEDYKDGVVDGHKVPSLVSRICRSIVDSNPNFDVSEFVSNFREKDVVIENLRQLFFWKLMNLHKEEKPGELFCMFDLYAENFSKLGPSHWHSEILRIANRFMTNEYSSKFISFVPKWYHTGNLRKEDWLKEKTDDGKEFPSLAVKTAKKCFDIVKSMPKDNIPDSTGKWLKDMYKTIMQKEPDDDWSVRNYATICVWSNETEEAVNLYKRLLIHMGDKYYLWSELANLLTSRNDLRIGLLLKAKKLERNEDFLGDIHLSLASLWQKEGFDTLANNELTKYATHRKDKGWSVSDLYRELQAKLATSEKETAYVNFDSYINLAEDYVYGDFEWTDFVVINKWKFENEERCKLCDGKGTVLNIKTKKFPITRKANPGDIIQIRCYVTEEFQTNVSSWTAPKIKGIKTKPLVARKTTKEPWSILPVRYGVIDYVNEKKKILHIITQSSKQTFSEYEDCPLPLNSFVKFREYEDRHTDETRTCITNVEPCSSSEAMQHMPTMVVAVDDVNNKKKLFHVVLGVGKISDIVRFDETDIRPSIGDSLRVIYCIKKNKEGKKRIKFLDIQTTDEECKGVKDTVTGRLELKYYDWESESNNDPDYAFVKDYYVHSKILQKYNITSNCDVVAKVILCADGKWKVYDLELCK